MSGADESLGVRLPNDRGLRPSVAVIALLLAALLVLAQGVQAWAAWQRERPNPAWAGEALGTLVSVMLVNGQVYYGELAEQSAGHLRLVNVYYVQAVNAQSVNQSSNQLVNRSKADWHGPQWMSIPVEKIMFVEAIGPKSRLAELIAEEKKRGAGG